MNYITKSHRGQAKKHAKAIRRANNPVVQRRLNEYVVQRTQRRIARLEQEFRANPDSTELKGRVGQLRFNLMMLRSLS